MVVRGGGVLLTQSWLPIICNFIEESDESISQYVSIRNKFGPLLNWHRPPSGGGRLHAELVVP